MLIVILILVLNLVRKTKTKELPQTKSRGLLLTQIFNKDRLITQQLLLEIKLKSTKINKTVNKCPQFSLFLLRKSKLHPKNKSI